MSCFCDICCYYVERKSFLQIILRRRKKEWQSPSAWKARLKKRRVKELLETDLNSSFENLIKMKYQIKNKILHSFWNKQLNAKNLFDLPFSRPQQQPKSNLLSNHTKLIPIFLMSIIKLWFLMKKRAKTASSNSWTITGWNWNWIIDKSFISQNNKEILKVKIKNQMHKNIFYSPSL